VGGRAAQRQARRQQARDGKGDTRSLFGRDHSQTVTHVPRFTTTSDREHRRARKAGSGTDERVAKRVRPKASVGEALYTNIAGVDGFIYESHQIVGECIVLFQSVDLETFDTVGAARSVSSEPIRSMLVRESKMAGAAVDL
jgi:hypothetical protein